ncbi:Gfo/Idh/MocA family oxidoreductase [Kibdelosporangium aridum]|uniref:Gfo/Idh/MocA family oxidoreductase n=1 Tax=Kibdelosporangium aridum TaxID=2030 RepID=UPI000524610A
MKVVVCGTGFGRIYLRGIAADPRFELAGILARGSERSRVCADEYGVPLYTSAEEVPDVDLVCVVVPNGVGGGPGAHLAQEFLERGIGVLLEHPIHARELADCVRVATRRQVPFHLNTFYVHLEPVRRFLAGAKELLKTQQPLYVEATGAVHVSYDLLDIVGHTVGALNPWALADPPEVPARVLGATTGRFPYRTLDAVIGGVPVTLRIHNDVDPRDPDHHTHLHHRVVLGTDAGTLTLASTHGPVLWSPSMQVPKDGELATVPGVVPIGPPTAPSVRETFDSVWPAGVRHALDFEQSKGMQYYLTLSKLWEDLINRLGYPVEVSNPPVRPVPADDLIAAVEGAR